MASLRRIKSGWRAEVARKGTRVSKVLPTKQAARDWAAARENLILNGKDIASRAPFKEILERYAREVSPKKRGARWEMLRLKKLARDPLASRALGDLTAKDFADWRDRRLAEVAPASVRREMVLLSAVLTQARKEWELISASPMADVRKPADSPARNRRPTSEELERLAHVAGHDLGHKTARAYQAFLFAIETGMRAGEIIGLTSDHVAGRVAHLPRTKNGDSRDVPLSKAALQILASLPKAEPVFGLTSAQLDALWRKIRDKAEVVDLRFHDSRHEAVTRLAKKLDVLPLAKMIGHRNIAELMTYYEESAADMASRLD